MYDRLAQSKTGFDLLPQYWLGSIREEVLASAKMLRTTNVPFD
ncbi:hypothetical protein PoMZ_12866 [Pyricularia oryzae]|uniref:Uncharacterized protein n=3 Tax=Pyricularia oryzae TaxID=318829 RepID=Q2KFT9_PYRO7|nr:hypothetical protein MGCH7_ch7g596 [Pyricularia oryzae 70-15]QBZ65899.1 hypothetical protein PoMZ_12866 [Pyricularia oryzae]